jgi:PAS domain S-box-containing protein
MVAAIRVLYVDDEPDLLEISKMFLERSGDFSVTIIDSAPSALELLEKEQFDAIISDYHMPDMDGIQFIVEVRTKFGQIPFILFTGRGREEVVIKAINSGADLYIQKGGETGAQFAELAHKTRMVVEKHTAAKALKESEEKHRRIVETANEGILAVNEHFVMTSVNERMAEMLGYAVDEILGKTIMSFMFEEDLADQQSKIEQRKNGQPGTYERRFRVKDGSIRTFNVSATPLIADDGSFQGSFAMLTDITDRKHAEEALHETNEYLNNLFDYANAPIIVSDTEFRITRFNHAFEHLIGRKGREVVGQSLGILFSETNRGASLELIRKKLAGERWEVVEIPVNHVIGKSRVVLWNSANIVDSDGNIISTIAQGQDITERKQAEDALQNAHDSLELQVKERTADLFSANMLLKKEIEERKIIAESLKEYAKMTSILNEVILTANKAETLPQLFRDSLDKSLDLLDFEAGGIYLVNRTAGTAEIHYTKNLPDDFVEKKHTIPIDAPPYDTLFVRNQPIITEHFEELSPELAQKFHFRSLASIPLVSKDMVIGALNVVSKKRYALSVDEKQVLTAIGRGLGTTIARMIAEDEVKKVSVNLKTLFDSINEMVFVLDMQGRILVVNNTVLKRLLYAPEELTGTNVLLLHVPERREEALHIVQGMIAGTIYSCPVPLLAKDDTRIEVKTTVTRGWWNNQDLIRGHFVHYMLI